MLTQKPIYVSDKCRAYIVMSLYNRYKLIISHEYDESEFMFPDNRLIYLRLILFKLYLRYYFFPRSITYKPSQEDTIKLLSASESYDTGSNFDSKWKKVKTNFGDSRFCLLCT